MRCLECRRLAATMIQQSNNPLPRRSTLTSAAIQYRLALLLHQDHHGSTIARQLATRSHPTSAASQIARQLATRSHSTSTATEASTAEAQSLPEKPDYLDNDESAIWDKLAAEFAPTELTVQDVSGGCGSMYAIEIASEKFRGSGMLKQQRMVNAVLGEQMKKWHGVQLRTRIP
ncbi:bola-like protein [Annulohypoxylon maeteangense]|uniref:bola-like protein n=1 Tax=Annulohypoxylon maeteangense TaxID=1927788 RepID=UPI00200812C9|nr:bola-like protein [Annulohypoxylon maeteangense]KAI0883497.1 bola-like protein [Annulohypoxylon maeteangense]